MSIYKIGIIKEGKAPLDKRVALTPEHCKYILENYPNIKIKVQPSGHRAFAEDLYSEVGAEINEDLSDCDILLGIKEIPIDHLIAEKNYMFFSHTIKLQPYNKKLLKTIIDKKIKLIDYEVITDKESKRLIGFGRYAGIVGCYNAFLTVGKKLNLYDIEPAYKLDSKALVEAELDKLKLPNNFKVLITGDGRVAFGALEIIDKIGIRHVTPEEFLNNDFNEPVCTRLRSKDFYLAKAGEWNTPNFYNNPENYKVDFAKYTKATDLYIACHYWNPNADKLISDDDLKANDCRIKVIADISCDVAGPIASTIRSTTIEAPFYGYDPINQKEVDFYNPQSIGVMAVDNLPCELPKDASQDFGDEFLKYVLPNLIGEDKDDIIKRATIAESGKLNSSYLYLSSMLD